MTAWGSCTLTHFDRQFLFFSGNLKNDDENDSCTYRLENICYTTMTTIFIWSNSPSNAQLLFVHKQRMGICHVVKNVLKKPVLIGPIESNIVKVQDMSEKAIENKVCYWITLKVFSVLYRIE